MKPILQKKRQPPHRGPLHILQAALPGRRKKHRAATADAGDMDEVPNFGVTSALVVILGLHLVAIGAIYVHNKMTSDDAYVENNPALTPPATPAETSGYEPYVFKEGDTFEIIARKAKVDLAELKAANVTRETGVGKVIYLPPARSAKEPEVAALAPEPLIEEDLLIRNTTRPPIEVDNELYSPLDPPTGVTLETQGEAVLIKPVTRPDGIETSLAETTPAPAPRAVVIEEQLPASDSSRSHTITSGDTLYALSRKYGVKVNELMSLNKITDPGAIQIGRVLQIP